MRQHKILLTFALIASLMVVFYVGSANAAWMSNATIDWIGVADSGNYQVTATSGSWTKVFAVNTSQPNAKATLAVLITAKANGTQITIEFTGGNLDAVYLM